MHCDAEDFHDHKLAVRQQIEYLAAIREAGIRNVGMVTQLPPEAS